MADAKANGRPPQPTPEQMAMMQLQQRQAAMLMRRETLSGIILNGMLAGMNWQPTGKAYPKEDAAELCRDAVMFSETLLETLYPPPPEVKAANSETPPGEAPGQPEPEKPAPIGDPPPETFGKLPAAAPGEDPGKTGSNA